jgi:hypothetical protein
MPFPHKEIEDWKSGRHTKMEVDKKQFRKMFPNLAQEMGNRRQEVEIDSIRSHTKTAEKTAKGKKNLSNYDPDIIDFLRRCDSDQQAEEIITYMERRGEVTRGYAQKLKKQLHEKGVRSFGPKKEDGYYFKISEQ